VTYHLGSNSNAGSGTEGLQGPKLRFSPRHKHRFLKQVNAKPDQGDPAAQVSLFNFSIRAPI